MALGDRVDQGLAVHDDRDGRLRHLVPGRAVCRDDSALHLLLASRDDERLIGASHLDPAACEQQQDEQDDDGDRYGDSDDDEDADDSGDLHG
ncbi:hypothetical protein [Microbacterium hydrocarbonoxydans]|uniref:hypothetical protein n=1 Tax=Microbacterium hydrocarbonoxydans TaxID=273678 RepID=UPI0020C91E08|nr:hypothetical protein [Microbacterium hydrocarbonoxydans]